MSDNHDFLMIGAAALIVLAFLMLSVYVVNAGEQARVTERAQLREAENNLGEPSGYENITAWEVKARMDAGEDLILVDVRSEDEYRNGHIDGAVSIPLNEIGYRYLELDPAKPIVVYCQVGARSQVACSILGRLGFPDVLNMVGGLTRWNYGLVIEGWPQVM